MKNTKGATIIILSIFVLILTISLISSVEITMKSEFKKGETFLAKVSGNFVDPVFSDNVYFYRNHIKTAFENDIEKINDEYYIYALLPQTDPPLNTTYSLVIKDIKYYQGSKIIDDDIVKNFTITNETADFSIKPGFIKTNTDFYVTVQNLLDKKINLDVNSGEKTVELKSGEIKRIDFSIKNISETVFKEISLKSGSFEYKIPAYIIANQSEPNRTTIREEFRFSPIKLDVDSATNSKKTFPIYIINDGEELVENIELEISDSIKDFVNISKTKIDEIDSNSKIKLDLEIFSDKDVNIKGQIKAKTQERIIYMPVALNFVKGYKPANETKIPDEVVLTCDGLGGKICQQDEKCSGDIENIGEIECCFAECKSGSNGGGGFTTNQIIGFTLLLLLIVLIFWFYKKKFRGAH